MSAYEDVRAVIQEELGAPPEEIWASFDPVPIASASLAQVCLSVSLCGSVCVNEGPIETRARPRPTIYTYRPTPNDIKKVHVARDHQGRKLAVKVQHRGLREISRGDVAAVCFMVNLVAAVFPEFSYRWVSRLWLCWLGGSGRRR